MDEYPIHPWSSGCLHIEICVFKGVFSKPSEKRIVAPIFFYWVRAFNLLLFANFWILLNSAKFEQDRTNLILDILYYGSPLWFFYILIIHPNFASPKKVFLSTNTISSLEYFVNKKVGIWKN